MEDHYAVLGVRRGASADEIHKAWRKLSYANGRIPSDADPAIKKLSEDRLKKLNVAHDAICNHDRRRSGSTSSARSSSSARPTSSSSSGSSTDSSSRSTGSSNKSNSSSGSSERKREEPKSPPPPPPPPKAYHPILEVDERVISQEVKEGEGIEYTFTVRHVSGELPPDWRLCVDGQNINSFQVNWEPRNRFPLKVTITVPPQSPGIYENNIQVWVEP